MSIKKAFEDAFVRAKSKGWDRIYVLVDIHGTVFKPSYHNEEKYEFYDYTKTVLQMLTGCQDIKLIMWTSSTQEMIDDFLNVFEKNGIHFDFVNENPEIHALPTDPKSSDFSNKFYFNIGLDDKFGFDPNTDWKDILEYFYNKSTNFFEDAKFGDKFIDNEGKIYIYHYKEKYKASDGKIWDYHWMIREPAYYYSDYDDDKFYYHPYMSFVFIDGYGVQTNLKYYSIESILKTHNKDYLIIGKYE